MRRPLTLARWLLAFLAIVNVYRAATQSLTTDEAFTYNRSVVAPIPELWESYDANDHVVHTLLCKVTTRWFGVSELSLRLPSLLGGFLFFWLALRLSRDAFGDGRRMLLSVALMALNPLTLDYCSIARGYGMAMALFLAALALLMREAWRGPSRWRLPVAGLSMALAVAANLTALVPCTALMLTFALLRLLPAARDGDWNQVRHRANRMVDHLLIPFVVVAVSILLLPLLPANRENFYVGAVDAATSLLNFGHGIFWRENRSIPLMLSEGMAWVVFPALLAAIGGVALALGWRWLRRRERLASGDALMLTGGLVLLWCLAAFAILHWRLGVPYPQRRTGLYLVPLVTLLAVAVWTRIQAVGLGLAGVVLISFLTSFNVRFYDEWIADAGTKEIMKHVAALRPVDGSKRLLATSAYLDHTARFYAGRYRLDWVEIPPAPVDSIASGDIYLLAAQDRKLVARRGLEIRYQHPLSGVALAVGANRPPYPSRGGKDASK